MAKRLPINNRPWPENLIFDFGLAEDTTAEAAEAFINTLSTTDRNKSFLRLRYIEGKSYKDIAQQYGLTPTGVRLALKNIAEKYTSQAVVSRVDNAAPASGRVEESAGPLIVDPAALNGIALIETIRVLYRKVGPENFEAALDELRDCLAALQPGKDK